MRKCLFCSILFCLAAAVFFSAFSCKPRTVPEETFMNNPALTTLKPDYPGNPYARGRFRGPYTSRVVPFSAILKWKLSRNPKAEAKRLDPFALKVIHHDRLPDPSRNYLMWLGHASFLLRADNRTLLLDPCLIKSPFYPRFVESPMDIRRAPADYVLISHGHYDHMDAPTLRRLTGNPIHALLPLKMGARIRSWNKAFLIEEAGWYQKYTAANPMTSTNSSGAAT